MRTLFIFLFVLIVAPAYSQILNVERNRQERDTSRYWTGRLDLTFLMHNRSATPAEPIRYISLGTAADLAYTSDLHRYMLISQLNYSALTGNAFLRTGYVHLRSNLNWEKTLSQEVFAQAQYDLGRGLEQRVLAGAGLRLNLVSEKKTLLALGVGAMWERERWQIPESEEQTVLLNLLKSTNYLSLRWQPSALVRFNTIVYYQGGYDNTFDIWRHRFSTDTNLETSLSRWLKFTTSFSASYDPRPVVPIKEWVYSLQNGIRFAF